MSIIPKFDLKVDISEEQFKQLEAKASSGSSKFFRPGNYDLKIVNAAFHKVSDADPSWIVVLLDFQHVDSERRIKSFAMVPTKSLRYNKPGIKDPMILSYKLRQLVKALGENNSIDTLKNVVAKLFQDPAVLVGKVLNVDIGFQGYYVDRVDGGFKIFERSGKEFKPETGEAGTYADRDSAIADAASYGIVVKSFAEVLKFNPAEETDEDDSNPWS